ncbi:MAG: FAD-binding oxidoreductase, partial [Acidimicrobiia bacterium]
DYQLHPLGPVFGGLVAYPLSEAGSVLGSFRDLVPLPDELGTAVAFLTSPEGHPAVGIGICYSGDPSRAEAVVQPLRTFGTPAMDQLGPMPYPELQSMLDALAEPGNRYYVRANFFGEISDGLVEVLQERYLQVPSPLTLILLMPLGGAVGRVAPEATAFAHRQAPFHFEIFSGWTDPADDDKNMGWLRDTWDTALPFLGRGVYVNNLDRGEGEDRVREAYGSATYDRLAALKSRYDPTNLFRLNQNIKPAASRG